MLRMRQVVRCFSSSQQRYSSTTSSEGNSGSNTDDPNHPIKRTLRTLRNDLAKLRGFFSTGSKESNENLERIRKEEEFQTHCDVLIIGGGGVGSSIAYWLKQKTRSGLNVVVVEKDPTFKEASTCLSVGGLRQQFSLMENIQMSLYGADFMRDSKKHLGDVDLNFQPYGYMMLASERGAEQLAKNSKLQNELGARNELLTPTALKAKFPWLNVDGIALGCHGLEKEGWFDSWALLMGFKKKAIEYGAHYVNGEVTGFEFQNQQDVVVDTGTGPEIYTSLDKAKVKLDTGEERTIKFAICVIAAGANSGAVGKLAGLGAAKSGLLSIPLPVEPRKRYVYVINSQGMNAPGLGTPLTVDPSGTYFRRDGLGGNYLCGRSPDFENEPSCDNLDVDHGYFETDIWPTLANRVPAFESAKVVSSWAGFYEYNMFDENGIIGGHPYYYNLFMATGFSGHGIQQTPAVGRAISELILDGHFRTIDLTRLGFDRLIVNQPMYETNIV